MEGVSRASLQESRSALEERLRDLDADAQAQVSSQLSSVAALLDQQYRLRRSLADIGSRADARAGLLTAVLRGKVEEAVLDTLAGVVRRWWATPLDLVAAVSELAADAGLASAETAGVLDEVEDELFRFARIVEREPRLSLALSDPALPAERKDGLLTRLLESQAQSATLVLVRQAVTDTRGRGLHRRLDQLTALAAERRKRLVAVVRVARELAPEQVERLRVALSRTYDRQVQVQVDLDPSVLGGAVVTVGDEILDGSVARRLEQVRSRLAR